MNIITDTAALRKEINSIGAASSKLTDRVQVAALSCIQHAHQHGDVTLASKLVNALGKGMKREALRLYLSEFGPMNPNGDKETKEDQPMVYSKTKRVEGEAIGERMKAAVLVRWESFKTERAAETFSLAGGLHALLGKLDREIKAGTFVPSEADRELVEALRALGTKNPKPAKKGATSVQ